MNMVSERDVKVRPCHGSDIITHCSAMRNNVMSKLPTRTGDENSHALIVADGQREIRAFSGSHQSRRALYHSTVSASPVSKSRVRFQPRALIRSISTE